MKVHWHQKSEENRKRRYELNRRWAQKPEAKEWTRKYLKAWQEANRKLCDGYAQKWRDLRLGISREVRMVFFTLQKGRCALCGKELTFKNAHLDHDHKTNRVRGLVCKPCNTGLSFIDKHAWVLSALAYSGVKISTS